MHDVGRVPRHPPHGNTLHNLKGNKRMRAIKAAIAGAIVLAFAGGGVLLGATSASAATPAFEPDPNASNGSITFYDASGNVITSGNNLSHLFDYAVASSDATRTGTTKASTTFAFPDHTKPDSTTWFQSTGSASTNFPNTTAPAPINGFGARRPVNQAQSTEANLSALLGTTTLDTTPGYANIVQIRLKDSGAGVGNGTLAKPFWATDIQFDAAAGTWTQVFPAVVTSTTTTLAATPNPSTVGNTVTLTATVAPAAAAGSVQFMDGATNIGSPAAVSAGTASTTTSTLTQGSHALSAVFTPTDTATYGSSTGTFTATVNPAATATATTLAVSGGYLTAGSAATLTATVTGPGTTPNGSGTVAFYDNASATAIPGTVTAGPTGTYVLDLPTGFTAGGHSVVAKFTPTDLTQFAVSQSSPQAFLTQAPLVGACAQPGSVCTDTQNVTATIPVGTLVINTPYTASAPLDLGTLVLDPTSTVLTGSKPFQNIVVTDTRSGNLAWTVSAIATNLSDGGGNPNSVINAQNLGLTGVAKTSSGAGFTGTLTYTANAAANGVAPGAAGSAGLGGTT
ncbi:MAG: hypothetical protein JWO57_1952, partial [Pseudonocardiales bacterium]|nr:hypothetical protein [Pseudonocardiales bacterium]